MSAHPRPPARRLVAPLLAAVLAASALGACSAGDSGAASDSSAGGAVTAEGPAAREDLAAPGAPTAPDRPTTAGGDPGTGTTKVAAAVAERKLARRADVALQVTDVARAASTLRTIASRAGGLVVAEEVSSDPSATADVDGGDAPDAPAAWGTVTISVPTEKLDATLDEVAKVGTVLSRQSSTDDVTAQYVDTAARVETMKASVERVRALMAKADRLADVVSLEAELSRRQADLEAMQQQLAALDDQVTLSPVTVRLSTDADSLSTQEDPTGFLAGLASGWDAFTTSVRLVLTLLGALLPFAVAAAVLGAPLVLWWRRRRVTVGTPTPPVAPTA